MKSVPLALLLLFSVDAFAANTLALSENVTGKRVIVEGVNTNMPNPKVRFYSCDTAPTANLATDPSTCDPMVGGRAFTVPEIENAMKRINHREMDRFLMSDTFYGMREFVRYLVGQPVDGLSETTYMGSAEANNIFTSKAIGLDAAHTARGAFACAILSAVDKDPCGLMSKGIVVGRGASGDFRGVRDGITAFLLFVR